MARRALAGGPKLRFMNDREFEDEAALLLAEYGQKYEQVIAPPIPIDEIVELYLELRLTFDKMQELFGVDDVHGALWVNDKRVGIDHRLEPTEHPAMLGRYRFTLAHEAGHWRLHRQLFQRKANQLNLLPEHVERPEYICRSSDTDPIEYQANRFASCLLMPREMLKRGWHEWRGNMDPICLDDVVGDARRPEAGDTAGENMLFERAVKPIADRFEVSPGAMRIRLIQLDLLQRVKQPSLF
jgi:hypothetical protein